MKITDLFKGIKPPDTKSILYHVFNREATDEEIEQAWLNPNDEIPPDGKERSRSKIQRKENTF